MKNDDIELLREVQKNAEMGMHALEVINPKVYDDSMALMLARESFKYGELHDRARAVLLSKNQAPEAFVLSVRLRLQDCNIRIYYKCITHHYFVSYHRHAGLSSTFLNFTGFSRMTWGNCNNSDQTGFA